MNKKDCILSIIDSGNVNNISLSAFNKKIITFGRKEDNDIVLNSPIISSHHGYFEITEDEIFIYDNSSKNGIFINNILLFDNCKIGNNDTIKIDNPLQPLVQGVLMILNTEKNDSKWMSLKLSDKDKVLIGRNKDCDIVLERVAISSYQAVITKKDDGYYLDNYNNTSGVIIDNQVLTESIRLRDKDVFIINDIKIIFDNENLLYQTNDQGVKLEAIDIVKTVRIKTKKQNISEHIDFTAMPGEFIAFVGGSGAGKSTFLKCISGVTKATSGKVLLNGVDLYNNYSALKNLIGYVPQENIIFEDLKLIDMLKYATNLRMPEDVTKKEKLARIDKVLEIVELKDKQNVMIKNLSGGQQKRACIAIELIADPKIFFLDEPTSGLDPGTERSIMKTLRKMANEGKTIILVTHNTLNLHLCDKVVFFGYGGKLCFDGKPSEALEFFKVEDFVDVYNTINEDVDGWKDKFKKSEYKKNIKEEQINISSGKQRNNKKFSNQFITLIKRKFKMLFNNKQQLLMLFGQVPLLAFLLTLVVTNDIFYSYEETKSIIFTMSNASIWLGLLNSIQEVCKEKTILQKEYMADLRLSSYIISKIVYLSIIAIIQAFLMVLTFSLLVSIPQYGLLFSWFIETTFIVFLTIIASSTMGLAVSSLAKDSSAAMTMPAILLIPQLLFSGMLFPLDGIVSKLSNLTICKWSVEALGTINDLNSLVSEIQEIIPGYVRTAENYFTFTLNHLGYNIFVMFLMVSIFIMISYFILKVKLESGR